MCRFVHAYIFLVENACMVIVNVLLKWLMASLLVFPNFVNFCWSSWLLFFLSEQFTRPTNTVWCRCQWLWVHLFTALYLSRLLGPGPPCASLILLHPGAAFSHRRGGDGHHASGLLPQHAGRLACGDPGDVWWAQDQREGRAEGGDSFIH